jgi:hypothetical protein
MVKHSPAEGASPDSISGGTLFLVIIIQENAIHVVQWFSIFDSQSNDSGSIPDMDR